MKVVAIGEPERTRGYALAGVEVIGAGDAVAALQAWQQLEDDVGLVLLTRSARAALGTDLDGAGRLWLELPH